MYGPVPTVPPRRRGARVGIVLLRVVLTPLPVLSIGMLGWIPLLYLAIVHRRKRDWLMFGASAAAAIFGFILIGSSTSDDDWHAAIGFVFVLGTALFVPAYFLAVELRPQQGTSRPESVPASPVSLAQSGYHLPVAPRQNRIEQVRSGLDELSAYLKQQDHS